MYTQEQQHAPNDETHYLASDGHYYPIELMPKPENDIKPPLHKRWWFWFALVGLLLAAKWMNGPDFQALMGAAENSFWRSF